MENFKEENQAKDQIVKELINDIRSNEDDEKVFDNSVDDVKPVLNVNHDTVKSAYKIKKRIQLKILSKGVPSNVAAKLSHLSEVNDSEAEIVKRVIDRYGTDNLSPELIELINKYINTPIWPWIEMEWALNEKMKAEISMIVEASKS